MKRSETVERFSPVFLTCWLVLPFLAFFLCEFVWNGENSLLALHEVSLFLSAFLLPFSLRRFSKMDLKTVLPLLVLPVPFYLAAGRLHSAGWRGSLVFLVLGVWIGLAACITVLSQRKGRAVMGLWIGFQVVALVLVPILDLFAGELAKQLGSIFSVLSPVLISKQLLLGTGSSPWGLHYLAVLLLLLFWFRRQPARAQEMEK